VAPRSSGRWPAAAGSLSRVINGRARALWLTAETAGGGSGWQSPLLPHHSVNTCDVWLRTARKRGRGRSSAGAPDFGDGGDAQSEMSPARSPWAR
jgi:hypothetical protein